LAYKSWTGDRADSREAGGSNRDENFKRGSSIHEHFHLQEEVYEVIEGELEMTIDGVVEIARAGLVAIVPSNVRHSVKALTDGRAIIVDYPLRREFA
jgi:quercetin dioxygenase-like cupin family protein